MTRDTDTDDEVIDVQALGWTVHEPPPGFADRVADAFTGTDAAPEAEAQRPRARWGWLAAAAGAIAAACVLWLAAASGRTTHDALDTEVLRTVALRDRALAVAQPGTRMAWEVESDGTTRVQQDAGRVFYRVDDGEAFEVHTPAGVVRVTGTCFEVDLENTTMNRQGLKAGMLGAALASAVLVTVYEGRVVLANDEGEVALGPGDRGRARASDAPSRWGSDDDDGASAIAAAGSGAASSEADEITIPPGVDPVEVVRSQARALERLRAQKEAQEEELAALREKLGEAAAPDSPAAAAARARKCANASRNDDCPFLEPDQETLLEMAKCGTVKMDHPAFLSELDTPETDGFADSLGVVDPQERAAIQKAAQRQHAQVSKTMRDLVLELGGDEAFVSSASMSTLDAFIHDQLDKETLGQVQRRISEERAGLREPPAPGSELSLEERFWRLRAELGNDFEAQLATSLGPERARELRSRHDGWPGNTSVISSDCRE